MNEVFKTGAVFDLVNNFSPELAKVIGGLERFDKAIQGSQAELKKFGFGDLSARMGRQLDGMVQATNVAVDKMIAHFDRVDKAVAGTTGAIGRLSATMSGDLDAAARAGADGVIRNLGNIDKAVTGSMGEVTKLAGVLSGDLTTAAAAASTELVAGFSRADASIATAVASAAALKAEIGLAAAAANGVRIPQLPGVGGGAGPGAGMGPRAARGNHSGGGGGHGGFHFRAHGLSIPGGHVGVAQGSSGMAPLIGAVAAGETVLKAVEHGFDFDHWVSQFKAAGFNDSQIEEAKKAAWANAGANPNASATDSLKNILELNKATGNLEESIGLLPTFSVAESAMQSVKAEDLHSRFTGGTQILNLAKGLEEMGVTTRGNTEEERQANTARYTQELVRTMIASRGLFDGNALFKMTNNSGGAAQNWDMRMGTVVAPIIGDIMNHSKLGNADYMSLKSFQGGHITGDAVAALVKYGLASTGEGGDAFQDSKGNWHLKANSEFAKGMDSNIWDWSSKKLDALKAHGIDTNNQEQMNAVINEIGSNKSNTMLLRAILEPGPRKQIQKEMDLRDKVPDDAAGVLAKNDPILKLDAFHKKWDDFLTALGGPMTDSAIKVLTSMASGLNNLAQAMEAHPDITKNVGVALAGIAVGLGALAVVAFTAFVPGGAAVVGITTLAGALTALATVNWSMFQKGGVIDTALTNFFTGILDALRKIPGLGRLIPGEAASGVPLPPDRSALDAPNSTGNALRMGDEMPAGFHRTSFGGDSYSNDNSPMVDLLAQGVYKGLMLYANGGGAAGGMGGGGSGFMNASWGGGGGGGGGGPINPGQHGWWTMDRQSHAVDVLMKGGVSEIGAKALVSRWMNVEASGGPSTVNGIGAKGIGQWLGNRGIGLPSDFDGQLQHALKELHGSESRALGMLNSGSAAGAAAGASQYERAEGYNPRTGTDNFTGRTLRGLGAVPGPNNTPTVDGRGTGKKVAPGAPANGPTTSASNMPPIHVALHLDRKVISRHFIADLGASLRHPTSSGAVDPYSHYVHSGTPLPDVA